MALSSAEISLQLVPFLNSDKVISILQINLGEYSRPMNAIPQLIYERQRIAVLHSDLVQTSIIHTKPQAPSMRLWDEQNRCTCWRLRRPNLASQYHFVQELTNGFQFNLTQ